MQTSEIERKAAAVPIGTILAFHPDITTPALPIPDCYMACDGSTVTDADSPLVGVALPDLNSGLYGTSGRGRYLRGGDTSGLLNESTYWDDNGSLYTGAAGIYYGCAYGYHGELDGDPSGGIGRYSYAASALNGNLNRRFQVAAMTVVWIMRIK
jgi:hypothetical protein